LKSGPRGKSTVFCFNRRCLAELAVYVRADAGITSSCLELEDYTSCRQVVEEWNTDIGVEECIAGWRSPAVQRALDERRRRLPVNPAQKRFGRDTLRPRHRTRHTDVRVTWLKRFYTASQKTSPFLFLWYFCRISSDSATFWQKKTQGNLNRTHYTTNSYHVLYVPTIPCKN